MRVDCRCGCALVPGWGLADYSGWGGLIGGGWSGGWFLGLLDVSWCARLAGVCYPVPAGLLGCSIPGRGARVVVGVLPLDVGGGAGALVWLVAPWFRLAVAGLARFRCGVVGLQRAGVFLFSGWVCWRLLAAGVAPGSCWWLALSGVWLDVPARG